MPNHRMLLLLVVLLSLAAGWIAPQPAQMQAASSWQVIAYSSGSQYPELLVINDSGLYLRTQISPSMILEGDYQRDIAVSASGYVVATSHGLGSARVPIYINSTTSGACCHAFDVPDAVAYDLAGFSPDGSQLALSYATQSASGDTRGGLMVLNVDLSPGGSGISVAVDVPLSSVPLDVVGGLTPTFARMGAWTPGGVEFAPGCINCGPALDGTYALWQPASGTFTAGNGAGFSMFADQLGIGGAYVAMRQLQIFPYDSAAAFYRVPNVVIYTPSLLTDADAAAMTPAQQAALPVIFFDPAEINLAADTVTWVADGHFVVVQRPGDRWTLIGRAGGISDLIVPYGSYVLAGTPDGWLSVEGSNLIHYTLDVRGVTPNVLATDLDGALQAVLKPALGASVSGESFTRVPPPQAGVPTLTPAPPAGVNCVGTVPTRLAPGMAARVTPGLPNNLRTRPSTSAPRVGLIPGGAALTILSGPECGSGFIYWYVNYNGREGYTAEGDALNYFIEPLR